MDNSIRNLRDTIIPRSDQLNADDLMGVNKVITVTQVKRVRDPQQPIIVHYEGDDGRPYKPNLTMRRGLILIWGEDGNQWLGRSMELYRDGEVSFGKTKTGGIKIAKLSHIPSPVDMTYTEKRGVRKVHRFNVLQPAEKPMYPENKFKEAFPAMDQMIQAGKMTAEQVITRCEMTGKLTNEQRQKIRECSPEEDHQAAAEFFGEEINQ